MTNEIEKSGHDRLAQAYAPSWYDRFSDWVEKSRLPSWLIYLLIPSLWILLTVVVQRLEGSGTIRDWEPISFVAIAQIGYILFLGQFLDKLALKALDDFRPALNIADDDYPRLQRLISTLPARQAIIVTLLFGMVGVFLILAAAFKIMDSTINVEQNLFGLMVALTMLILWLTNGLFTFHTYHQLSVVNYIYTNLTIVHPFHQRELFAFSGFSARTGIALVLTTPLWIVFDPGLVSLVISIVFGIFGLIAFVTPLIGVHNILGEEKDRLLDENAKEVEKTIETLMIEMKEEQPEGLELADQRLSSLEKARIQIERISTWPWKNETLRQMLAAVLLPLIIWLLQFFLTQVLSR